MIDNLKNVSKEPGPVQRLGRGRNGRPLPVNSRKTIRPVAIVHLKRLCALLQKLASHARYAKPHPALAYTPLGYAARRSTCRRLTPWTSTSAT